MYIWYMTLKEMQMTYISFLFGALPFWNYQLLIHEFYAINDNSSRLVYEFGGGMGVRD